MKYIDIQKTVLTTLFVAMLMTLALPCAASVDEKKYIIDNTGIISEKQLKELNVHAQNVSDKHGFNITFLLTDSSYRPDSSLFLHALKRFSGLVGYDRMGFMMAYDKQTPAWTTTGSVRGTQIFTDTAEVQLYTAFNQTAQKGTFYDGIMAYLDATDEYFGTINLSSYKRRVFIDDVFVPSVVMLLIPYILISIIIMLSWKLRRGYVGIQTQKRRNNFRSVVMLSFFPFISIFLAYLFTLSYLTIKYDGIVGLDTADEQWIGVLIGCGIGLVWLVIAYYINTSIISFATGSKPLERRENKRVYNLVENLCMATQTAMPKINVIESESLNAFACGINKKTYTITLSRGLIDKLDDSELEAVIAHELSHIRNNDAKVMIVSIIFVGIFAFLTRLFFMCLFSRYLWRTAGKFTVVILGMAIFGIFIFAFGFLITKMLRFAISRSREYMADAGSVEMTKNPLALATALRKISAEPYIESVMMKDVAQLFISNPRKKAAKRKIKLFATHPPIEKRIKILEQF